MAENNDEEASGDGSLTGSLPLSMQSNPRMRSQASTRSVLRESPSKKKSGGSRSHGDRGFRRRGLFFSVFLPGP